MSEHVHMWMCNEVQIPSEKREGKSPGRPCPVARTTLW